MKMSRMGSDKYLAKNTSRIDTRKLGVAILIGSCIVILAYLVSVTGPTTDEDLSKAYNVQTSSIHDVHMNPQQSETKRTIDDLPTREAEQDLPKKETEQRIPIETSSSSSSEKSSTTTTTKNSEENKFLIKKPDGKIEDIMGSKPICDQSSSRSDVCEWRGDARLHGKSMSVVFVADDQQLQSSATKEWRIKPYARKALPNIPEVSVRLSNGNGAPQCTIHHDIPAVVFSVGGFTGNYYHDYTDVIVPLFTTARQFDGEVQLLVSNIQPWWLGKYRPFLEKLSNYKIIDFTADDEVRCFRHAIVGVIFHSDLTMNPARTPKGVSTVDFTKFMREVYSLKREEAINLKDNPENRKPRLLIISRGGTRKFMNAPEIARMAEELDFEVMVTDPKFGVKVEEFAGTVNSFDVMIGVHGAGLTNFFFLPTQAVLIQVVPYGNLEDMAKYDFGFPSVDAKLHYLQYSISVDESTLLESYPRDHAVFTNPRKIHELGWEKMGKIYLIKQNVKIDVNRFRPVLVKARELLHR